MKFSYNFLTIFLQLVNSILNEKYSHFIFLLIIMKNIKKLLVYLLLILSMVSLVLSGSLKQVIAATNQNELEINLKLQESLDNVLESKLSISKLSVEKQDVIYSSLLSRLNTLDSQDNTPNRALLIWMLKQIVNERISAFSSDFDNIVDDLLLEWNLIVNIWGVSFDKIEVDVMPGNLTKVEVKLNNVSVKEFSVNSTVSNQILNLIAAELNTTVDEIQDLVVFRFNKSSKDSNISDDSEITIWWVTFDKINVDVRPDRLTKVEVELNDVDVKEFRLNSRDRTELLKLISIELNTSVANIENHVLFRFRTNNSNSDESNSDESNEDNSNSSFVKKTVTLGWITFDKIKVDVRPDRLTKIEFELNEKNVKEFRVSSQNRTELLWIIAEELNTSVAWIENSVLFRFRNDEDSNNSNSNSNSKNRWSDSDDSDDDDLDDDSKSGKSSDDSDVHDSDDDSKNDWRSDDD